jgi:hypothetical protein
LRKKLRTKEVLVLGILKIFRINELLAPDILKRNQIQRTVRFWVFQKLQRTTDCHERTSKDPIVVGRYLDFFFDLFKQLQSYVRTGYLIF